MLSKVLNNYVCNLAHANVCPDTNDMHANKYITHARHVSKAIRLFRYIVRIIATIPQGFAVSKTAKAGVLQNKPAAATSAASRIGKPL
jgi:hypothetical protein